MKKAFVAYARADKNVVKRLLTHLKGLKYAGKLETWYDGEITAGESWEEQISNELNHSDIVVLCVTADFLASEYVQTVEMPNALNRVHAGQCKIIPVILKPCAWEEHPFARFQVTPERGRPVTDFPDQEKAWAEVMKAIDGAIGAASNHTDYSPRAKSAPTPEGAPAKRFLGHQAPSDRDIDEFVLETLKAIRRYFLASVTNLEEANPGWQGKIQGAGDDAFEATIYNARGERRTHCGIFLAPRFGSQSPTIGYSATGVGNRHTFNDTLTLAQGNDGPILKWLSLTSSGFSQYGGKNILDPNQACEHLWKQFTQHMD